MFDLTPAANRLADVVRGVDDDQLDGPTPCTEFRVRDLLTHVLTLSVAFADAARKVTGSRPPEDAMAAGLDPAWREKIPARLDELAAAWTDPEAWDGMTEVGGVELPGKDAAAIAVDELVLHGWDLARATGQEFHSDPMSTQIAYEFAKQSADESQGAGTPGLFGRPVAIADDASLLEQALGYSGRDPSWTPS